MELLPTSQTGDLMEGLTQYLGTTFALSDTRTMRNLTQFLQDPENGIFKGPFVRLRLPFRPAAAGWRDHLDWYEGFTPYGHQARAFERLSSKPGPGSTEVFGTPEPTLVTTGTGSGKTESFLFPILDHVLRANRAGIKGTKALVLYPMNALANDQARRLTQLITEHPALSGVTAALFTGETSDESRTTVTESGLITDRATIRQDAPDILLTNYKMLDMMLLRPEDAGIWEASAHSLQYLVLDEFHTYDGAQGTDVSLLLRRLGLILAGHRGEDPTDDSAQALGSITPVATSATLGSKADPDAMLRFAATVFGRTFGPECVVTEDRLTADEWGGGPLSASAPLVPSNDAIRTLLAEVEALRLEAREEEIPATVARTLGGPDTDDADTLLSFVRTHPLVHRLLDHGAAARSLEALAADVVLYTGTEPLSTAQAEEFLSHVVALLSHVRARATNGRDALSVETHLWVRELTRLDAAVDITPVFRWADDGVVLLDETNKDDEKFYLPSLYCRHCGRSGWGAVLAPVGLDLDPAADKIRGTRFTNPEKFRAFIAAPNEADEVFNGQREEREIEGLHFLHTMNRTLQRGYDEGQQGDDLRAGHLIPVLALMGPDAAKQARDDVCPACLAPDAISFTGSALATQLSVSISVLFGADDLDPEEKKALVFTDSVQDAAHRAGFVQARAHTMTLRSALRHALDRRSDRSVPVTVPELVDLAIDGAETPARRFALTPPELAERKGFKEFWEAGARAPERAKARKAVAKRLLFDAQLELGLNARTGRTLELTGSVSVEVQAGSTEALTALARTAVDEASRQGSLFDGAVTDELLAGWARGLLERIRLQGGLDHVWLDRYQRTDGKRWQIWGGRPRNQGMPAFPAGRPAPSFPRVGSGANESFDAVLPTQSWYARWTQRALDVAPSDSGRVAKALLDELVGAGVLRRVDTQRSSALYVLPADRVQVGVPDIVDLREGRHALQCIVCKLVTMGGTQSSAELRGAPCTTARCTGTLEPHSVEGRNFYRDLYSSRDSRRVVAREHTSLLPKQDRLKYETEFKDGAHNPAAPNVLVATPTLEMGIDIGDLSTVMLASLPPTVANYVQRVGRAGRLTGNALVLTFVSGRGTNLPKLHDPLSVIDGEVRPPATYLGAREIVRRQFTASVLDRVALDPGLTAPRTPSDVLRSIAAGTWLGAAIDLVAAEGAALAEGFATAVSRGAADAPAARESAREALVGWIGVDGQAAEADGVSGFESHLSEASRSWNRDVEDLRMRRQAVNDVIPELKAALEEAERLKDESRIPEARREYGSARATAAGLGRRLDELREKEYWVSILERYGLLPNYTLLDDTVDLEVAISWADEETGHIESDSVAISRGAAAALAELAPGATFYAQSMEIGIDAVDLGPQASAIETWQLCPDCGWIDTNAATRTIVRCERCGRGGIADVAQTHQVVVLKKVSAEVRRDEAAITDRSDERLRESFSIAVAADIDPDRTRRRWYTALDGGTDGQSAGSFGAEYVDRVNIRWLNLGRRLGSVAAMVAGDEYKAPKFTVCKGCGKLDQKAGANQPLDHRAWCRFRKVEDENNVHLALARELLTQAVVLHLPASLTYGDNFALPSLQAALLLGLREFIGGDPDHLGVLRIADPGRGPDNRALLLHDKVPGGTGYLDDFSDPDRVRAVLQAARDVLAECGCGAEGRLACHHCLLPFATTQDIPWTSRSRALGLVDRLLGDSPWEITAEEPAVDGGAESFLEKRFRNALVDRLRTEGVTPTFRAGELADVVSFRLRHQDERWILEAQVDMDGTRPDFVLWRTGTPLPALAIYTDGMAFHASPEINRVADDAAKRAKLRDHGTFNHLERVIPWAVTSKDVEAFETGSPAPSDWVRAEAPGLVQRVLPTDAELLSLTERGALDALWQWIDRPDVAAWERLSEVLPMLWFSREGAPGVQDVFTHAHAIATGAIPAGTPSKRRWTWSDGSFAMVADGVPPQGGANPAFSVAMVLDERPERLGTTEFEDGWRRWLRISNLLGFGDPLRFRIGTVSGGDPLSGYDAAHAADAETPALPGGWADVVDQVWEAWQKPFLETLSRTGVPVPDVGEEIGGVPVAYSWAGTRVAVLGPADAGRQDVEGEGWLVVAPEAGAVAAAFEKREGAQ